MARRTHRQGAMLEVISRSGIGFDTVDLDAAAAQGVVVCNTPDAPSISTAEHTMSLLMAASKFTANNVARLRAGRQDFYAAHEGIELSGATIGVVGHGRIGSRVARMCAAMDMRVIVCDPYVEVAEHEQVDLDTILTESRIITMHTPLTDETRNLLGAAAFARMQDGVVIVNAARGGVIDTQALVGALDSGKVYAAGLDVTAPEPLDPGTRSSTATMSWSPRTSPRQPTKAGCGCTRRDRERPPGPRRRASCRLCQSPCLRSSGGTFLVSARKKIRVGVVGFGWMGQAHTRSILRIPTLFPEREFDAELVMISDNMASRVDQAVADFGFGHGSVDWNDLIANDDIDVVVICAPNMLHEPIAIAAAEAGKHVFCEKPVVAHPNRPFASKPPRAAGVIQVSATTTDGRRWCSTPSS